MRRLLSLVIALISLGTSPALAQQAEPLPRTRVTTRAKGRPSPQVLNDLGKQAGVRLTAVRHLADKRLTLLVQERPLADVMQWLASLWSLPDYPARWRRKPRARHR